MCPKDPLQDADVSKIHPSYCFFCYKLFFSVKKIRKIKRNPKKLVWSNVHTALSAWPKSRSFELNFVRLKRRSRRQKTWEIEKKNAGKFGQPPRKNLINPQYCFNFSSSTSCDLYSGIPVILHFHDSYLTSFTVFLFELWKITRGRKQPRPPKMHSSFSSPPSEKQKSLTCPNLILRKTWNNPIHDVTLSSVSSVSGYVC